RPVSGALAVVVVLAAAPAAGAQELLLRGGLKPGPHAVGYRTLYQLDHTRRYDPERATDPAHRVHRPAGTGPCKLPDEPRILHGIAQASGDSGSTQACAARPVAAIRHPGHGGCHLTPRQPGWRLRGGGPRESRSPPGGCPASPRGHRIFGAECRNWRGADERD